MDYQSIAYLRRRCGYGQIEGVWHDFDENRRNTLEDTEQLGWQLSSDFDLIWPLELVFAVSAVAYNVLGSFKSN